MQVAEGRQLRKARVPYSVAALHVELSQVVQAGQTAQLVTCNQLTAEIHVDSNTLPDYHGR